MDGVPRTAPVYVHSKLMLVDDRVAIIGSGMCGYVCVSVRERERESKRERVYVCVCVCVSVCVSV
jgi:hypothetical protein